MKQDRNFVAACATPPQTIEQFFEQGFYTEMCDALREAQQFPHIKTIERRLLKPLPDGVTRSRLAGLAGTGKADIFVATVEARGSHRKRRSVLVKSLRRFGLKFVFADHVWIPYDRHWERIEPFLQGLRVVLVATIAEYKRQDGTGDYSLSLTKVTKLWPSRRSETEINKRDSD